MRVLLVWPNSRNELLGWGDLGAIAEPLALEYLAAGARLDGHEVELLDLRLHPGLLPERLENYRPDLVGITAFSMHVLTALSLFREVRSLCPNAFTVAGGHHATLLPEDFFEPQLDFVVCGEGVRPLRSLLAALTSGTRRPSVPGIWTADETGSFRFGGPGVEFAIDEIPLPDRQTTAPDRGSYFIDWMKPVALLRTSVGCPFRCIFCSLWKIMDGRYHMRSNSAVVDELREIEEEWVFLVDDEAFIHGSRMRALAAAIEGAGIRKRFFSYCRIDSVLREQEALSAWRRIGLERLFIGIDAIADDQLAEYHKRCRVQQIEDGLAVAERLGIEIFAQFVVNPNFSHPDFQKLVRFIEHHRIRYPSFTVLTPIPGTELLRTFEHITERQPNGRPDWDLFDCQNAVTETRLTKREFRRAYRNLYHVFKGAYTQYREHSGIITDDSLV